MHGVSYAGLRGGKAPPKLQRPSDVMVKRKSLSPVVLLVVIVLLAVAHIVWLSFVCDDAFISFRYAKNLVEGHGLIFNPGERVEGYTNFLWVLMCALVIDAGARPEIWAPLIGGLCALGTLFAVMWYQYRRGRAFLMIGILLAANGGFATWATGGLETSLFTLLVTLGILFLATRFDPLTVKQSSPKGQEHIKAQETHWLVLSAVSLFLAALTRPEGVLIAGFCGVFLLIQVFGRKMRFAELMLWAAAWVIPYGIYFAWRYSYYGNLFPNTFYVKSAGPVLWKSGVEYLLYAVQRFHVYLLLIPAVALLFAHRSWGLPRALKWLIGIVTIPYLAYIVYVGGDFMDMFRFIVPIAPVALLAIGSAWQEYFNFVRKSWSRRAAVATVSVLLVAAVGLNLHSSWDSQTIWFRHGLDSIGLLRKYYVDWTEAAHDIAEMGKPTDSLATTAAGIIPYYTDMYTIDQLGLIAPDLSQYIVRDVHRPGHVLLAKGEYLFRLRPQFILGHVKVFDDVSELQSSLYIEEDWYDKLNAEYSKVVGVIRDHDQVRYFAFAMRNDLVRDTVGTEQGADRTE
jgi:arabinofuranosyltransferase